MSFNLRPLAIFTRLADHDLVIISCNPIGNADITGIPTWLSHSLKEADPFRILLVEEAKMLVKAKLLPRTCFPIYALEGDTARSICSIGEAHNVRDPRMIPPTGQPFFVLLKQGKEVAL